MVLNSTFAHLWDGRFSLWLCFLNIWKPLKSRGLVQLCPQTFKLYLTCFLAGVYPGCCLASAAVLWDQRWKKAPTFSTAWGAKPPGSHAWICDEPKSQTFKFLVSTPFHPKNEDSNQQVALWLHQLMESWATLLVLPLHFPAHGPAPGPELQAGDNSGDQLWFPARWHCGTVPQEQFGWQASGLHQI